MKHEYFGTLTATSRTRLSLRVEGSGPDVVLIHGLGASSRYFTPLAHRLSEQFRVLVPELPGHGKNNGDGQPISVVRFAHEVALALREMNTSNAITLGHSMGAQVALELSRWNPALVQQLILAAPAVNDVEATLLKQAARILQDLPLEQSMVRNLLAIDYLRCGIPWWSKSCRQMLRYPTIDLIDTAPSPVHIVCGSLDPVSPASFGERLAAKAVDGSFSILDGASHGFIYSHAAELNQMIRGLAR